MIATRFHHGVDDFHTSFVYTTYLLAKPRSRVFAVLLFFAAAYAAACAADTTADAWCRNTGMRFSEILP